MSDITLRGQKGEPLTHNEVDENFANLNSDKYEAGNNVSLGSATLSGDLTVDTDTLFVSTSLDQVGINTASPTIGTALDVNGITSTTSLYVDQDATVVGDFSADSFTLRVDAINNNVSTTSGNGDGKGITFNSITYNAATTLDWYEEGSFTPVLADATTGGNTATMTTARGRYTRIGNAVHCSIEFIEIDATGLTGGNAIVVRNLPFVGKGDIINRVPVAYWNQLTLSGASPVGLAFSIVNNQTYGNLTALQTTGVTAQLVSGINNGVTSISMVFTYLTNT